MDVIIQIKLWRRLGVKFHTSYWSEIDINLEYHWESNHPVSKLYQFSAPFWHKTLDTECECGIYINFYLDLKLLDTIWTLNLYQFLISMAHQFPDITWILSLDQFSMSFRLQVPDGRSTWNRHHHHRHRHHHYYSYYSYYCYYYYYNYYNVAIYSCLFRLYLYYRYDGPSPLPVLTYFRGSTLQAPTHSTCWWYCIWSAYIWGDSHCTEMWQRESAVLWTSLERQLF